MKLYHYGFKKEIITEGLNAGLKHKDTEIINDMIYDIYENYFGRDYCIFLNLDKRDEGEILVSVESDKLNQNLLYIANQELANDIYRKCYQGHNCEASIKQYVSSIIPFKDYNNEYDNPELMYLDSIEAELLKVEYSYL